MAMMRIDGKIEPFLIEAIKNTQELGFLQNIHLNLTYNRFDVAFKFFYIDGLARGKLLDFEKEYYKQHLKAISLGSFSEPGNLAKNTFLDYENTFEELYVNIKQEGFDQEKSLIPLAIDGSILNGAHRTAIAIYLKKAISAVKTPLPPFTYEYHYFKKRGVPEKILDAAALKYLEYANNCFLAIIWPAAIGHESDVEELIDEMIYKKEVKLNYRGAHNLLSEAYQNEPWLGSANDNYPGINHKLTECFPNFGKLKIYLFQRKTLAETLALKENIRQLFNIGKHAIHITDTDEETQRIGRLLLNEHGLHFLNNARPHKYQAIINKIDFFKEELNKHSISSNNYVLTSNMVMAIYGLRDASVIDYLGASQKIVNSNIDYRGSEIHYHGIDEENIIRNPEYHFWFRGVKFISLPQLYVMKEKRKEKEDIIDVELIKTLIEVNNVKSYINDLKYKVIFIKSKLNIKIISLIKQVTKTLYIYSYVEKMYRKYK